MRQSTALTAEHRVDDKGHKYIRVKGIRWFTNLDFKERHEDITLYKRYSPEEYPRYSNYNAIEVSKTADIPDDYYDPMGVPITFLDRHNPDQFEIIGSDQVGFLEGQCLNWLLREPTSQEVSASTSPGVTELTDAYMTGL